MWNVSIGDNEERSLTRKNEVGSEREGKEPERGRARHPSRSKMTLVPHQSPKQTNKQQQNTTNRNCRPGVSEGEGGSLDDNESADRGKGSTLQTTALDWHAQAWQTGERRE